MENLQGTLLKGYKLEERIGAGGFGAVYRAKQTTIGREVAVKIILPGYANNPDFIRRFESEAHLIARLEHPHITPLHDFWRDPDGAYLVMRFLRNGSIRDALDSEPYELPVVSQLLDQIASGLDFAHRNDVIHRDIKPGNILLDEDGNAYLADFGIAKDLAGITDNKTAVDAVVGSLDYISPEQARSEPVTPRTDIYSLGVTLYEMITGEHPYKNISTIERLYKHINDPLPEITSLPADLQDVINDIIQKATAKDPEDRYPDVLALAVAFREGIGRDVSQQDVNVVEQLTMREHEVLALIAKGLSNRDIAAELVVSIGTVKWHINSLYKKLAVRSRVQAIVRARELNLITNGHTTDELSLVTEQSISISLPEPENPYKGLHSFQMTDARDFFGRDDLVTKLIDQMTDPDPFHRFVAIVGPSGSGKSSLAKAGLIPALWKGAIPGSEKWFVVDMIPGTHPMDKLETALIRVAANQTSQLREQLQRDERGLLRVADIILPGDDTELVIVVDQFEEVFTLVEDEQARQGFLDLLRVAVSDVRSRVRVIVTLRADYYDRPLHYPEFGELIRSRMETVLPLSAKGLERAVRGPAERVGMTFEQGLVEQIVSQMNYQAGALPLLQYALTELFDRRSGRILTNEAYQEIGGAVGALANRADEIYRGLTEEAQELAHQMFMRLVTLGEGAEDTRRRVTHAEFLSLTDNTDLMEEIIDQFSAYRLLSLDHDPETRQPTVEVAHEAILREWDRLRQWLSESRDDIRQERTVSRAAEEWNIHGRDVSYLLRGARLEQVEKWRTTSSLIQTPLEQDFITQSLNQHEIERQDEIDRKQRELQLEQRSRNFLRGLVAVLTVAAFLSGGFGIFALNARDAESQARLDAETSEQVAQQSAAEFRSIALAFSAQDALNKGQPDMALALAQEAINIDNPPFDVQQTYASLSSSSWIRQRYQVSDSRVYLANYHPDGERIITSSWDGRIIVWDRGTGEELQSVTVDGATQLNYIDIHPNGEIIAIGGFAGELWLWNTVTNQLTNIIAGDSWHNVPLFTSDGESLITASGEMINIWNMETLTLRQSFVAHAGVSFIASTRFNNDETQLITSAGDGFVRTWDFASGELIKELDHNIIDDGGNFVVWDAQLLNDSNWLLTAGSGRIALWNWELGELIWMNEIKGLAASNAILEGENWFLTGTSTGAQLYDLTTGLLIRDYIGHEVSNGARVQIHPDGDYFITNTNEGAVIEWPIWWEGSQNIYSLPIWDVEQVVQHPTQSIVAIIPGSSGGSDRTFAGGSLSSIYIVNTETGETIQELVGHRQYISTLTFSNDGHYLLSGDYAPDFDYEGHQVYVWDWEHGERITEFSEHVGWLMTVTTSPNGQLVASGDAAGNNIFVWDIETGEILHHLTGHQDWLRSLIFSPDGQSLYSTAQDGHVFRWDVENGNLIQEYGEGLGGAFGEVLLTLNSDGTQLLASYDGNVSTTIVWNTESGEIVRTLPKGGIFQFNENEALAAIYSASDGTLILWDFASATVQHQFSAYQPGTRAGMSFGNDDSQIITAANGHLIVWNVPTTVTDWETWIKNNRYIPDFTCEQRALYQIEPLCEPES